MERLEWGSAGLAQGGATSELQALALECKVLAALGNGAENLVSRGPTIRLPGSSAGKEGAPHPEDKAKLRA